MSWGGCFRGDCHGGRMVFSQECDGVSAGWHNVGEECILNVSTISFPSVNILPWDIMRCNRLLLCYLLQSWFIVSQSFRVSVLKSVIIAIQWDFLPSFIVRLSKLRYSLYRYSGMVPIFKSLYKLFLVLIEFNDSLGYP